jgi:hypothetical protein
MFVTAQSYEASKVKDIKETLELKATIVGMYIHVFTYIHMDI